MNLEFRTKRLHTASYLIGASVLEFLRAEMTPGGRIEFVFRDDHGIGPKSERAFDSGALAPANQIFSATTYLRRWMDRIRQNETGESHVNANSHRS